MVGRALNRSGLDELAAPAREVVVYSQHQLVTPWNSKLMLNRWKDAWTIKRSESKGGFLNRGGFQVQRIRGDSPESMRKV